MRHFRIRTLAISGVAAFALAACGSSSKAASSDTTAASTAARDTTTAAAPATAAVATNASVAVATTKLGTVLVDAKGFTLYRFDNDTTAGKSTCAAGPCATTWPAATVTGAATGSAGIDGTKLTTFKRDDGATQLQIDGHPLYTFAGDTKAGDTNGQGIGGKWYAAGPDGGKVGDNS